MSLIFVAIVYYFLQKNIELLNKKILLDPQKFYMKFHNNSQFYFKNEILA